MPFLWVSKKWRSGKLSPLFFPYICSPERPAYKLRMSVKMYDCRVSSKDLPGFWVVARKSLVSSIFVQSGPFILQPLYQKSVKKWFQKSGSADSDFFSGSIKVVDQKNRWVYTIKQLFQVATPLFKNHFCKNVQKHAKKCIFKVRAA